MKKQRLIMILASACVLFAASAWAGPPLPPPPPFGFFSAPGFSLSINTPAVHARIGNDHYRRHHPPRVRRHHSRGHWEVRKVWIPPVTERVWNPGHYNRRGHWVRGRWIEVEKRPGYWKKERVWIAYNDRGRGRGHRHHR